MLCERLLQINHQAPLCKRKHRGVNLWIRWLLTQLVHQQRQQQRSFKRCLKHMSRVSTIYG